MSTTTPSAAASPTYAQPGPNVVGITTVHLSTRVIDVFYPARRGSQSGVPQATYDLREPLRDPLGPPPGGSDAELVSLPAYRDLPAAAGSFPVVLFSHDLGGFPLQDASLESSIAAWGFVVIAPDPVERDMFALSKGRAQVDDVHDAKVLFSAMSLMTRFPRIGRAMDLSHVAAVGHAQGGGAAMAALGLPGVGAAVAWASSKPSAPVVKKPVMLIGAQHDLEFGTKVQSGIYSALKGPHSLVLLGGDAGNARSIAPIGRETRSSPSPRTGVFPARSSHESCGPRSRTSRSRSSGRCSASTHNPSGSATRSRRRSRRFR